MIFSYHVKQFILLLGDLVSFIIAFWLSLTIRQLEFPSAEIIERHAPLFGSLFALWIIINYISGLYDLSSPKDKKKYAHIVEASIFSVIISVFILYAIPQGLAPKTILFLTVLIGYGLGAGWRLLYTNFLASSALHTRVILLGYNQEVEELLQITSHQPEKGYQIVALFDPENLVKNTNSRNGLNIYRNLPTLRPAVTTHKAHLVITAPHLKDKPEALRELYELLFWPVQITDVASFYEMVTGRVPPSTFTEGWFLSNLANINTPIYNKFRRGLDIFAAIFMAMTMIVLFPLIAIGIKCSSKGPLFFGQKRMGQFGSIFTIYKFRTMYALAPDGSAETSGAQFTEKEDNRITPFGKLLRKMRLDEVPQAINLFRGDITLVGPRPERPEIVKKLEERMPYYTLRHMVKPGITGWAAINQHYTDNLEQGLQKLQYDLYYIKNRSLLLDLSILLKTINVVIRMMGQ